MPRTVWKGAIAFSLANWSPEQCRDSYSDDLMALLKRSLERHPAKGGKAAPRAGRAVARRDAAQTGVSAP